MFALDNLGGAKYIKVAVSEHPEGWGAGAFARTFGDGWKYANALLATGRCPRFRMHSLWTNHTYNPKRDDPLIRQDLQKALKTKDKFPSVDLRFSPICENLIKGQQQSDLFGWLLRESHGALTIVNSGPFYRHPRIVNEVHGDKGKPVEGRMDFSTDGQSVVDVDIEKLKRLFAEAETFYFWNAQHNGKKNDDDKTPIDQREAYPQPPLLDSEIYLHRPCGAVSVPKLWTYKSHADQHSAPVPEPRAWKPVLIIPQKSPRVEFLADNGQTVYVSSSPQPFVDGRWRYYFGDYGYLIAEKARRIQGHAVVRVVVNGKVMAKLNPAFRAGDFR